MFHMLVRTWEPRHWKLICRFCHGETRDESRVISTLPLLMPLFYFSLILDKSSSCHVATNMLFTGVPRVKGTVGTMGLEGLLRETLAHSPTNCMCMWLMKV